MTNKANDDICKNLELYENRNKTLEHSVVDLTELIKATDKEIELKRDSMIKSHRKVEHVHK